MTQPGSVYRLMRNRHCFLGVRPKRTLKKGLKALVLFLKLQMGTMTTSADPSLIMFDGKCP